MPHVRQMRIASGDGGVLGATGAACGESAVGATTSAGGCATRLPHSAQKVVFAEMGALHDGQEGIGEEGTPLEGLGAATDLR